MVLSNNGWRLESMIERIRNCGIVRGGGGGIDEIIIGDDMWCCCICGYIGMMFKRLLLELLNGCRVMILKNKVWWVIINSSNGLINDWRRRF